MNGDRVAIVRATQVVSYLTYHGSTPFSDELWSLFDQMIRAFHGFACDYIAELVPSLDNFVSRDTEKFLASSRLESLVGVPERFLWPDHQTRGGEEDCRKATHVLLSVLHNCRGRVDEYVRQRCTPLIAAALERALGPPRADNPKAYSLRESMPFASDANSSHFVSKSCVCAGVTFPSSNACNAN